MVWFEQIALKDINVDSIGQWRSSQNRHLRRKIQYEDDDKLQIIKHFITVPAAPCEHFAGCEGAIDVETMSLSLPHTCERQPVTHALKVDWARKVLWSTLMELYYYYGDCEDHLSCVYSLLNKHTILFGNDFSSMMDWYMANIRYFDYYGKKGLQILSCGKLCRERLLPTGCPIGRYNHCPPSRDQLASKGI